MNKPCFIILILLCISILIGGIAIVAHGFDVIEIKQELKVIEQQLDDTNDRLEELEKALTGAKDLGMFTATYYCA